MSIREFSSVIVMPKVSRMRAAPAAGSMSKMAWWV
jgi:hypothetical protein